MGKIKTVGFEGKQRHTWARTSENVIEIAKSEILKDKKLPMGNIISERDSCPLISEKTPEVRKEAIQQKVKCYMPKWGCRPIAVCAPFF